MFKKKNLTWLDPLELAFAISCNFDYRENWIFLYSGLDHQNSYIALYPQQEIIADDFKKLEPALKNLPNQSWFGYLGYDLKNQLEKLKTDQKSFINLPNLWMINYHLVLKFNHDKKQIDCYFSDEKLLKKIPQPLKIKAKSKIKIQNLKSNFSKKQYFSKLLKIKNHIVKGDLYQANLTRKFAGKFGAKPQNIFEIFIKLNKASPANYSAFLKLDQNFIISSSPELFLTIDYKRQAISKPIKGTAPRFSDPKSDLLSKIYLQNSAKEKAENLMIVDLTRNDLSRNCLVGSVKVKNLFKIASYKTIHHMSSEIIGIIDPKYSALNVIKSCFPPPSMTGTPKIKAMEICGKMEIKRRGIYSGAIGFISQNQCNLSVVIRTIIIKNNQFEFQVGGAITFDSDPEKEWQETMNKAKGIAKTLNIKLSDLKKI